MYPAPTSPELEEGKQADECEERDSNRRGVSQVEGSELLVNVERDAPAGVPWSTIG